MKKKQPLAVPYAPLSQKFQPYSDIPFSPRCPTSPTHTKPQLLRHRAIHKIQSHFAIQHRRYKSKQNHHRSQFKIKVKKQSCHKNGQAFERGQNQMFWVSMVKERMKNMRTIHERYLQDVGQELERRSKWSQNQGEWNKEQKVIQEYNIIYEYKTNQITPTDHTYN